MESLYDGLAASKPAPAAVTAAAVSARFGMALLMKALEVTARRSGGDSGKLLAWAEAARGLSAALAEAADEDIAGEAERKRMEIPMKAARAAAAGLDVCAEAAGSVRGPVAADLGAAAMLLGSAVRAILMCVDANVGDDGADERRELERSVAARVESIIGQVSGRVG